MFEGHDTIASGEQPVKLTLYTDAYVVRGMLLTRQRRVTDMLNEAANDFLVLTDAVMDEYGSRTIAAKSEYVQINLAAVLFAVADTPVETIPELRTPKVSELAMISIPPFRIVGRIHLLPERSLREALSELVGRFVPVTDALYWSDTVGEARSTAPMVAFNHGRAQILAPHRDVDPWEGLDRSVGLAEAAIAREPDAIGEVPAEAASTSTATGVQDPWGFERAEAPPAATAASPGEPSNPWGGSGGDPWGAGRPKRDDELIG